jgi:hypothetical protein
MKLVMVGTPALDGSVRVQYLCSLLDTIPLLTSAGWHLRTQYVVQNSLVMDARNHIVGSFLDSDANDLIMIDSDIGWVPSDFLRLLKHDVPIVSGVYQRKSEEKLDFTVKFPVEGAVRNKQTGLFKAERVGAGFLRLRRDALELMIKKYGELQYQDALGKIRYCLFDTSIRDNGLVGEDFTFCDRWRAIGGEIWVDPDIRLSHIGNKTFNKSIWDVLRPQYG